MNVRTIGALLASLLPLACGGEANPPSCPEGTGCLREPAPVDTTGCYGHADAVCQELCENPGWSEWVSIEDKDPALVALIERLDGAEQACGFSCTDETGAWRCVDEQLASR